MSRIEHTEYFHSGAFLLTCQIDASINSGNSGGPVIRDGQVVGVAFQGMAVGLFENIGYMVPAPVIHHFLTDVSDGVCHGTPDLGLSMQKMENPDLRQRYRLPDGVTGALVSRIYPGSSALGLLEAGDVVLRIDDYPIENDGTIEFRPAERTFLGYAAQKKQIGEQVTLAIWRNGQRRFVSIPLTQTINFDRLIPHLQYDRAPDYHIAGGLVFSPVSLNYINEFVGGAPTELLHYFANGEMETEQQQVVVLVKVLADEYNIGYHGMENIVVERVNGCRIYSMADLRAAFGQEPITGFHVIEDRHGFQVVLGREELADATQRILRRYGIAAANPVIE